MARRHAHLSVAADERPLIGDTDLTVARYLGIWLEGKQALRPSTYTSYAGHIRLYLVPHLGPTKLRELRPEQIEAMFRKIAVSGPEEGRVVSASTARRIHATLTSAMTTAVRRGLIERNPAATVELPKPRKSRLHVWSAEELGCFLDAIVEDRLHALYVLLGVRGLRRGEVVALRWEDVDLDNRTLRVDNNTVRVGPSIVVGAPKSASGARVVAFDELTAHYLRWHAARQRLELRLQHGHCLQPELVFTKPDGSGLDPAFVSRHFDRLVTRHGMRRIRLHDLRHTSASVGLASGESLVEVSRRLGHSSISVTADVYSHINPAVAQESAERISTYIFNH